MNQTFLKSHSNNVFTCIDKVELRIIEVQIFKYHPSLSIKIKDDLNDINTTENYIRNEVESLPSNKEEFMEAYNQIADRLNDIEI
jgi:hypothetical protein